MEGSFQYYLECEDFYVKYAKGEPFLKEREFHHYHEFVFFIEGSSYLISKNIQQELSPGSIIIIPKEEFHQFHISNPSKYKRFIFGFSETSEISKLICEIINEVKILCMPHKKITELFEDLIEIVKSDISEQEKLLYIRASLVHLLIFLKQYSCEQIMYNVTASPIVMKAINYIDAHYKEKISIESIAKHIYVSPSGLAHKFSKELHITIYQYISKKRVLSVQNLVESGASYSEAAIKSGFSDYSCFYRIYKKYYNK